MKNSSELAFQNFLMNRKLEELLKLAINEKDELKFIYIKRGIYMKVNYLDDENRNLSGLAQYMHKRKIKSKYRGTKYEKFIEIKKTKIERYSIIIILIILCFFLGAYIKKNILQEKNKKVTLKKEYSYAGKNFIRKELESILKIKIHLAEEYKKNKNFQNAYLRYLDALEITKKLKSKEETKEISLILSKIKEKLENKLDSDIEDLKKLFRDKDFIEKVHQTIKLSQLLQEFEKQGEIYGVKGEYYLQNKKFGEARSNYMIAKKLSIDKKIYIKKINEIEDIIANSILEEREKILKIQNRGKNE